MANKVWYLIKVKDLITFLKLKVESHYYQNNYFYFVKSYNLPDTVEHFGFPFGGMEQLQLFDATDDGDMVANITLIVQTI